MRAPATGERTRILWLVLGRCELHAARCRPGLYEVSTAPSMVVAASPVPVLWHRHGTANDARRIPRERGAWKLDWRMQLPFCTNPRVAGGRVDAQPLAGPGRGK